MSMHIITNNEPRNMLYGNELTEKERKEFDYIKPKEFDHISFIRYRGEIYDLSEFMHIDKDSIFFKDWNGYIGESYFSGILVKLVEHNTDQVIMGRFYC